MWINYSKIKIILKKTYKRAQEIRKSRRLSPAVKKRKQEIYSEGHFCGDCGSFMDDEVKYCGECGSNK